MKQGVNRSGVWSIVLCSVLVVLCCGCSTKKNTRATRSFHQFTTRYNVYFNANNSFQNGKKSL